MTIYRFSIRVSHNRSLNIEGPDFSESAKKSGVYADRKVNHEAVNSIYFEQLGTDRRGHYGVGRLLENFGPRRTSQKS